MPQLEFDKSELLKPENMILLYAKGAFPMADEQGDVDWYFPETRTIIPLDNYNYPRSLRKFMEKTDLQFKFDNDPIKIIKKCADREKTWISNQLIMAYKGLIKTNHIHTVEVYENDRITGGLFGVAYRGAFFGESMFSLKSQSSKAALIKLIEHLKTRGYELLDVQFQNKHLKMFGAVEIDLDEFYNLLKKAYSKKITFL
jgi:leucyl/phenylalanyl-tRNA--protein transferase